MSLSTRIYPHYRAMVSRYGLLSDQVTPEEIAIILSRLEDSVQAGTLGDVVEFGCYNGTTSVYLQRVLAALDVSRQLYAYDSFQGLPEPDHVDHNATGAPFVAGALRASKRTLVQNFSRSGLTLPIITAGWFRDLEAKDLPESIAFAFLDGDFYNSIKQSLALITPRLSSGAIVVIDDYRNPHTPGAARAVDEWRQHHDVTLQQQASLAVVHWSDH